MLPSNNIASSPPGICFLMLHPDVRFSSEIVSASVQADDLNACARACVEVHPEHFSCRSVAFDAQYGLCLLSQLHPSDPEMKVQNDERFAVYGREEPEKCDKRDKRHGRKHEALTLLN